jgi:hypothetical protein
MQSKKVILLQGLSELEKLAATSTEHVYKYVVENCNLRAGRKPMVWQSKEGNHPTAVINATSHFVAVCQLQIDDIAPPELPRVRWAYL